MAGYQYVYARILRAVIETGDFHIISCEEYKNEVGQPGIEYVCEYRGRRFYISESQTQRLSSEKHFSNVLKNENGFDMRKPLIWPNRYGEDCLYLEAWYVGRWYKFHTPMKGAPADEFQKLISQIP
jgi:hypothetical protein